MSNLDEAYLMIAAIRAALANGVVHRDAVTKKLLTTDDAIIEALAIGIEVEVDESNRSEVTTVEDELAKIKRPAGRSTSELNLQNIPIHTPEGDAIKRAFKGEKS